MKISLKSSDLKVPRCHLKTIVILWRLTAKTIQTRCPREFSEKLLRDMKMIWPIFYRMSMAESISRNKRLKLLKDKKLFWSKKIVINKFKKTVMIDSLKDFNKQKMSMMICIQPLKKVRQCFREATEVVKEV